MKTAGAREAAMRRAPMAELLHALNQPLTGLQCSLEVALACPRTVEQYTERLREGLIMTERMRTLVAALREVADAEEERIREDSATEIESLLLEKVEDLRPVAETKGIELQIRISPLRGLSVWGDRTQLGAALFRILDSVLALASPGSLRVEIEPSPSGVRVDISWQGAREESRSELSAAHIGLLVAQARLEGKGAGWGRTPTDDGERLSLHLPRALSASRKGDREMSLPLRSPLPKPTNAGGMR